MFTNIVYRLLYFFMRKERKIMLLFLVNRIINGYLHFWEIPKTHVLRDDVKRVLIEEGLERLIIEEKPEE